MVLQLSGMHYLHINYVKSAMYIYYTYSAHQGFVLVQCQYTLKLRLATEQPVYNFLHFFSSFIFSFTYLQFFTLFKKLGNSGSSSSSSTTVLLFLLLLKKVGSARLRESYIHHISPKTPAPQYQPIDRKKRKRIGQ